MRWDTLRKTGLFYVLLTSKGGNIAFPPPSPPCNVVPMFELPIENNKHPNFEWRGQGRGVDYFVLWSYPIWVQCLNNFVADCRFIFLLLKSIFSDNFLYPFKGIKLYAKWIKRNLLFKLSYLESHFAKTLGCLDPALDNLPMVVLRSN